MKGKHSFNTSCHIGVLVVGRRKESLREPSKRKINPDFQEKQSDQSKLHSHHDARQRAGCDSDSQVDIAVGNGVWRNEKSFLHVHGRRDSAKRSWLVHSQELVMTRNQVFVTIIGHMVAVSTTAEIAEATAQDMVKGDIYFAMQKAKEFGEVRATIKMRICTVNVDGIAG